MPVYLRLNQLLFVGTLILILLTFTKRTDPVLYEQVLDNVRKIDELNCLFDLKKETNEECLKQLTTLKE